MDMSFYPFYLNEMDYVRHRSRMVRQSIYEDAKHTLKVRRDYAGRLEDDPDVATVGTGMDERPDVYAWLDDDPDYQAPLLGEHPLTFIEAFPEGGLAAYEKIELNTLSLDNGQPEAEQEYELGGILSQGWVFTFALNASTDAVAMALFQDLTDRYIGRVECPPQEELLANLDESDPAPPTIKGPKVTLYNYAVTPPIPVVRMEVEEFKFAKTAEEIAPGVQLFLAELVVRDFLPPG